MLPSPSPLHHVGRFNHIPPHIGHAPLIFTGTAASSPASSINQDKVGTGLEPTEYSPEFERKLQPPASPKNASSTPEIPAKEKNAPVPAPKGPATEKKSGSRAPENPEKVQPPPEPIPEVSEKEESPPAPAPKGPEIDKKGSSRVPEIPEKVQPPPEPIPEVSEKEKSPPAPPSKGPKKEKKPDNRVPEIAEKEQLSPEPVPEVPAKEKKPPILVPDVPEKLNGQAVVTYKSKIEETRDLIRVIDESRLTKEQHDTFNSIHSFLEKAQEAFSQDDMSMAVNLAEKANTLAKEIVRNSP